MDAGEIPSERALELCIRAEVALDHGRPEVALEMLGGRDAVDDPELRLRLRKIWAIGALRVQREPAAIVELQHLIDEADQAGLPMASAEAKAIQASAEHQLGDVGSAVSVAIDAMAEISALITEGQRGERIASGLNTIGYLWLQFGVPAMSLSYFEQVPDHVPGDHRLVRLAAVNHIEATVEIARAAWVSDRPIDHLALSDVLTHSTALVTDVSLPTRDRVELHTFSGMAQLFMGRPREAVETFAAVGDDLALITDNHTVAMHEAWWAAALRHTGDHDAALTHARAAQQRSDDDASERRAMIELVHALNALGNHREALEALDLRLLHTEHANASRLATVVERLARRAESTPADQATG